jgi:hypothetical protein
MCSEAARKILGLFRVGALFRTQLLLQFHESRVFVLSFGRASKFRMIDVQGFFASSELEVETLYKHTIDSENKVLFKAGL